MLAIAEMYVKGVSTRDAAQVMREFGLKSLSSTQVSRAAALLDEELAAWRTRPLGEIHYLFLDARYEKLRDGGVVRDAACSPPSASGRTGDGACWASPAPFGSRSPLATFLDSLIDRGLRGVRFIVSDDHAGLKAARRAVLPGASGSAASSTSRRTPFTTPPASGSASGSAPSCAESGMRARSPRPKPPWPSWSLAIVPPAKLAAWLEHNVPEGLAVFTLPDITADGCVPQPHRTRDPARTQRRTSKVRVFPSADCPRCGSPAPSSSRSTKNGPPTPRSTSTGTARMRDRSQEKSRHQVAQSQ